MKRLIALTLCLMMALYVLPAQALTLAAPFTFDLDSFQSYYPQIVQEDVAWMTQDNWVVGKAETLPDLQLYMSEAGEVEYILVEISCPIDEAGDELGKNFGIVVAGAALSVLLCEVTDSDVLSAEVDEFQVELVDVISCFNAFDDAEDDEKMAGLTSYGPLANHEGCVGVQASEDGMLNLMFVYAPKGTQF